MKFYTISPDRLRRALASRTPTELQEDRALVVETCLEVMRDCPEQLTRMEAYEVLVSVLPDTIKPKRWSQLGWDKSDYVPGRWPD